MDPGLFSPGLMAALPEAERGERLRRLEAELAGGLDAAATQEEFFLRGHQLIAALKELGHDLWSFDSDGEAFESWCGDPSREDGGGSLVVTFRYPREVQIEWAKVA